MKIANFSHKDLDGISCPILLKTCFEKVYTKYCNYDDIDEKIIAFVKSGDYKTYDKIFITDISVKKETAEYLNAISDLKNKLVLLDHHPTALFLNEYDWAYVEIYMNPDNKTCGTQLLNEWLIRNKYKTNEFASYYVEMVRRYDTWEWKEIYNDNIPYRMNVLFGLLGKKEFSNKVIQSISSTGEFVLSEEDNKIIDKELNNIKVYVDNHMKGLYDINIDKYSAKVCFAENNINDIAHSICEKYPDIDIAIIINISLGLVSYRTEKEDINLGMITEQLYDGGGHPKAAGSQISKDFMMNVINSYFIR